MYCYQTINYWYMIKNELEEMCAESQWRFVL